MAGVHLWQTQCDARSLARSVTRCYCLPRKSSQRATCTQRSHARRKRPETAKRTRLRQREPETVVERSWKRQGKGVHIRAKVGQYQLPSPATATVNPAPAAPNLPNYPCARGRRAAAAAPREPVQTCQLLARAVYNPAPAPRTAAPSPRERHWRAPHLLSAACGVKERACES
jgi:hypothetical protein